MAACSGRLQMATSAQPSERKNVLQPELTASFPTFDSSRTIAIVGLGVMGAKVAWSCASSGIPTRGFDINPSRGHETLCLAQCWGDERAQERVRANLAIVGSLAEAVQGAQLAFENVPEKSDLKASVIAEIAGISDSLTYIGTNTSSLLCAPLAMASGRPERFFAMNFTDPRDMRLAELMAPLASSFTLDFARQWARHLGMVPITVRRDQMGYCFNRLWRTIKKEVLRQIAEGVSTPTDIDRCWMLAFGTPYGPCGLMDQIGLESILRVELQYATSSRNLDDHPPRFLYEMIEQGHVGARGARGFYNYPDPAYREETFLTNDEE